MDPKSGIFTATVPGCYLFCLTLCSQDMKKVLVALRKNGEEVMTLLIRDAPNTLKRKGKLVITYGMFRLGQSMTKTTTTTTAIAWPARLFSLSWKKGIKSRYMLMFLSFSSQPSPLHQVYAYTFTGLHDKSANHLTQFLGFMLRPKAPPFLALQDQPTGR